MLARPQVTLVCSGLALALVLLMTGCGNGGGGSSNNHPPPAAPAISYGPGGANVTQFTFTAQTSVSLTPTNAGGPVTTWTITPALPAGLAFESSTGAINGTPTNAFAPTNVTVTAANAGGSSQVTLTLGAYAVLLNLGASCFANFDPNVYGLRNIAISSANVLTEDGCGVQHWVLWNYSNGAILAQGDACPIATCLENGVGGAPVNVALGGQIAVVPYIAAVGQGPGPFYSGVPTGFQVISITDGSVVATVVPSTNLAPYAVIRVAADPGSVTEAMPPTALDVPVQPSPVPPPLAVQLFALVDAQVRVVDRRT